MRPRMPHKAVTEQHTFLEPAHVFYYHIMIIGCSVCILYSVGFMHFGLMHLLNQVFWRAMHLC